jgi:hypothetical protein
MLNSLFYWTSGFPFPYSTCLIFIKTEISQSTQKDKLLFANHYTKKRKVYGKGNPLVQ